MTALPIAREYLAGERKIRRVSLVDGVMLSSEGDEAEIEPLTWAAVRFCPKRVGNGGTRLCGPKSSEVNFYRRTPK